MLYLPRNLKAPSWEANIFSDQSGVANTLATSTEPRTYRSIAGFIKEMLLRETMLLRLNLGMSGRVNVVIEDNTFISNVLTANYVDTRRGCHLLQAD